MCPGWISCPSQTHMSCESQPACSALIRACSGRRPYVLPDRYNTEIVKGGGMVKPVGILFIHLVEARNVPRTDTFSKTDCYARCCRLRT